MRFALELAMLPQHEFTWARLALEIGDVTYPIDLPTLREGPGGNPGLVLGMIEHGVLTT